MIDQSPWERGYADGVAGKPGPSFPTADSSWAERLYHRGWQAGVRAADPHRALAAEVVATGYPKAAVGWVHLTAGVADDYEEMLRREEA